MTPHIGLTHQQVSDRISAYEAAAYYLKQVRKSPGFNEQAKVVSRKLLEMAANLIKKKQIPFPNLPDRQRTTPRTVPISPFFIWNNQRRLGEGGSLTNLHEGSD